MVIFIPWYRIRQTSPETNPPGNSAGDLFGMVKMWPFQRISDLILGLNLGIKRSQIESPGWNFVYFFFFGGGLYIFIAGNS